MKTARDIFQDLRKTVPLDDYAGLSQSERSTRIRHRRATEYVRKGDTLLDLGCGTGLILDTLGAQGAVPGFYIGVDVLGEGAPAVARRCGVWGIGRRWMHTVIPDGLRLDRVVKAHGVVDAVLCIGVMGYAPYDNPGTIRGFIRAIRPLVARGYVTVPVRFDGARRESWFRRQTLADMAGLERRLPVTMIAHGPHEVGFGWGR